MDGQTKCSKCDDEIVFTCTANRKMQPIDRRSSPDGNVVLTGNYARTERGQLLPESRVLTKAQTAELAGGMFVPVELEQFQCLPDGTLERHMPHHATCPFAYEFHRAKAPK